MKIRWAVLNYCMCRDGQHRHYCHQSSQSFLDNDVTAENNSPTSQVCVFVTLVLPIIGNYEVWVLTSFHWHSFLTKFYESLFCHSRVVIWQNFLCKLPIEHTVFLPSEWNNFHYIFTCSERSGKNLGRLVSVISFQSFLVNVCDFYPTLLMS